MREQGKMMFVFEVGKTGRYQRGCAKELWDLAMWAKLVKLVE